MPARVHPIPDRVFPATCGLCKRHRTCCALVTLKGRFGRSVVCAGCRIRYEGWWTVDPAPEKPDVVGREPRVRQLGRGLRARSPSKHGLPFTF